MPGLCLIVIYHLNNKMSVGVRHPVAQLTFALLFIWLKMQIAQNLQKARLGYIKH